MTDLIAEEHTYEGDKSSPDTPIWCNGVVVGHLSWDESVVRAVEGDPDIQAILEDWLHKRQARKANARNERFIDWEARNKARAALGLHAISAATPP
jgi:hypothetical protein